MLDTETKRRIDTARDILVGKVPDPKSQVEQITIALIYKFMDDMDAESEELGGERQFFAGDYQKYSWTKLMAPNLGGFDVLNLYSESIQKMNLNPNIPQLFRDIFKNAFLPYRDPETLKSFLKTINEFEYDHSERLGDAFEYLLSVLGSQGEAGQFRTPRHIIDFMVEIIAPQKHETILDPACGTAGFLISSYKHILKHNSSNFKTEEDIETFKEKDVDLAELSPGGAIRYNGDKLTPDERGRLSDNIRGYDISPDMVRLSLVNLYLHGFTDPHIIEYDTLTSEERWHEFADVILANPPFMSPKGGIRPHKRFSVQSKRSEVLFVDYMAEHLSPAGRAAVIVPEGVIFQSGTAYKQLRQMLVEKYLIAVVSLPAGVFQPYSGVKTSILLMDKALAKKSDHILFVKVENDGFDLGAQRRPIDKNDLPAALRHIRQFISEIHEGAVGAIPVGAIHESPLHGTPLPETKNVLVVEKTKIAENGEWNLSGERYRKKELITTEFPLIPLEQAVVKIKYTNKIKKSDFLPSGRYPIIDQSEEFIAGYWNNKSDVFFIEKPVTIFGDHTRAVKYVDFDFVLGADGVKILQPTSDFDPKFFFYIIQSIKIKNLGYSRHFKELKERQIPLPPLDIQQEIVAEIDGYQKIIDGARQVVKNYKPHIQIDPDWPLVELGEAELQIIDGDRGVNYPKQSEFSLTGHCVFLNTKNVLKNGFNFENVMFISREKDEKLRKGKVGKNDVVLTTRGTVGNVAIFDEHIPYENIRINSGMLILRPNSKVIFPKYIFHLFQTDYTQQKFKEISSGSAQPQLPIRDLKYLRIPLPDLDTQNRIIAEIEKEQALINVNKQLMEIYQQKIKTKIAAVWGEL